VPNFVLHRDPDAVGITLLSSGSTTQKSHCDFCSAQDDTVGERFVWLISFDGIQVPINLIIPTRIHPTERVFFDPKKKETAYIYIDKLDAL